MVRSILVCALWLTLSTLAAAQEVTEAPADTELRQWTDTTGKFQIDAKLVVFSDNQVTLQREDGSTLRVPLSRLSAADRSYVRKELRRRKEAAKVKPEPPKPDDKPAVEQPPVDDRGLGILPMENPRVFVHVEGMPAPKPEECVRARYTDPNRNPQPLVDAEAERLKTAGNRHLELEKKFEYGLVRVETHNMVVHAQLPPEEARKVGLALEAMKIHLQQATGTMVLTPLRPDEDEMIIALGKEQYLRLLKIIESENEGQLGESWDLVPQLAGGTVNRTSFFYTQPNSPTPPAHLAVSQAAASSIQMAVQGRSPAWLMAGFSAYCENVVLGKNLVHSVDYQKKDLQFDPNWAVAAKRLAATGALKPWDKVLNLELRDYETVDHVEAYAIVAYLLHRDPQKFLDLLEHLAGGANSAAAIEQAYGQPIAELQQHWFKWLTQG